MGVACGSAGALVGTGAMRGHFWWHVGWFWHGGVPQFSELGWI